ncbi:MAG: EAL domain-containing protein [candidate division WOR-3 bacterium]|nr:EAL domain-containing protein [candidate division WOR-3 bacterium]
MNNDIEKLQSEVYRYRINLFDRASGLPTVYAVFDELRRTLEQEKVVGILYIAIGDQQRIEPIFGWEVYDELIKFFTISVMSEIGKLIPRSATITVSSLMGDGFFIFLSKDEKGNPVEKEYLRSLSAQFREKLGRLRVEFEHKEVRERIDFHIGYGLLRLDPMVRTERLIYQTMEDIKYAAHFSEKLKEKELYTELLDILDNNRLYTVYQPIYNLDDSTIYGYEALTRGPRYSFFEDPDTIFSFAAKYELLPRVEELCLYNAIKDAAKLNTESLIFFNITPDQIPRLIDERFIKTLAERRIDNERVVIEITEKFAIPHYGIYQAIVVQTRGRQLKIALDDIGVGYSTLERISEIGPDYLKYDRALVRDIDKNLIRQELIKSFVHFARRINSTIIAEGIENENELEFLKGLGIKYGQGFYLCPPKSAEELV